MEFLNRVYDPELVSAWEAWISDWSFWVFLGAFVLEMLRQLYLRKLTWTELGDGVTNYITLGFYLVITYVIAAAFYVSLFYWVYFNFALVEIPTTGWTILLCLVLADIAYYWEHRFAHRVGFAWATHTVHHSSPYFNISVAFRFGPFDGLLPLFFYLPLALLGFNPLLIFACEMLVQIYQTALHTTAIGKLPRPIEAVMNTPSHHRVHHGSNEEYLDTNYAGLCIIWDKMFGTFAEERAEVVYGLTDPINSINPFVAFFHGFVRLGQRFGRSRGLGEKLYSLIAPPEWLPESQRQAGELAK
jgi:sterol desaturase/sphingolipid hydroxylase (fatty acid hydroxylase superfamily)